ncbi:hypothetical protein VM1G_11618 [Cytospora mali]|uniref:Uncharacterized protein n=1 Tax=Cytospora mali TaxID=578113 RepID=A0A194VZS4_CYTMA|nr:hypothetical protein VM1G_11618 [Valsa mali]
MHPLFIPEAGAFKNCGGKPPTSIESMAWHGGTQDPPIPEKETKFCLPDGSWIQVVHDGGVTEV